jgi:hypothetical protein
VPRAGHREPLHPAGQTRPERVHRAHQPNLSRGSLERVPIRLTERGPLTAE